MILNVVIVTMYLKSLLALVIKRANVRIAEVRQTGWSQHQLLNLIH